MRILSVGFFLYDPRVAYDTFRSTTSFLDFDLIVWDPGNIGEGYKNDPTIEYRGFPLLNKTDSPRFVEDLARREAEISEILRLGRSIVVFMPPPSKVYVYTGEQRPTAQDGIMNDVVVDKSALSVLPVQITTTAAAGSQIEVRSEKARDFWVTNKGDMRYRAYISNSDITPFFYIHGTDRVVGGVKNIGNGYILFLPYLDNAKDFGKRGKVHKAFIDSVCSLLQKLSTTTEGFALPDWAASYLLPGENKERESLADMEDKLQDLVSDISKQKQAIAEIEQYKVLFSGSGRALEIQVAKVLQQLGFTVEEGEAGRDDLILRYANQVAVVEVKGVAKSAAEKHAAQLEKWASEYYSTNGVHPKAILIINAYKDQALETRAEPSFPAQMRPYSERREHCLISTLQLLCLFLDCKDNLEQRDKMIEALFNTNGVFPHYEDWSKFLNKIA